MGNKLAVYLIFNFIWLSLKTNKFAVVKTRFLSKQKLGPRFSLCCMHYIQGHVTALSYQCRLAIIYFWVLRMITFNLIYDSLCHLSWYRSAIFSHLAHGLWKSSSAALGFTANVWPLYGVILWSIREQATENWRWLVINNFLEQYENNTTKICFIVVSLFMVFIAHALSLWRYMWCHFIVAPQQSHRP